MPSTTSLLTATQLARARVLYVDQGRPPSEVAAALNAEFEGEGLKVAPRQITEVSSYRKWGAEKKALAEKTQATLAREISTVATKIVQQNARLNDEHREFLERSVRIGTKALDKAEALIERSNSARDLSSAVNAASRGISIYRAATGLDSSTPAPTSVTNFFSFARGPESPFYKPDSSLSNPHQAQKVVTPVSSDTEQSPQSESTHALAPKSPDLAASENESSS